MDLLLIPEFPYAVTVIFPEELGHEDILMKNISRISDTFPNYICCRKEWNAMRTHYKTLKFTCEKEKFKDILTDKTVELDKLEKELNKELHPYYWRIHTDFKGEFDGRYIKADYVLTLERYPDTYDE